MATTGFQFFLHYSLILEQIKESEQLKGSSLQVPVLNLLFSIIKPMLRDNKASLLPSIHEQICINKYTV